MRKMAAYAAARMEDGDAIPRLAGARGRRVADVRWNAALALATLGDASGMAVLVSMCDRAALRQTPGLTAEQQEDALLNGLQALVLLKDADARARGAAWWTRTRRSR